MAPVEQKPPEDSSPLHELLPDVLSALCDKFENVECELKTSPDFFPSPYRLQFTKIGTRLTLVPTSDWPDLQIAIREHMNGNGASLGILQGFHVLCSSPQSPGSGLRIRLKNSKLSTTSETRKTWRSVLSEIIQRHQTDTSWEFLCVELFEGSKSADLILLKRSTQIDNNNSTTSTPILNLWLFPFLNVVPSIQVNGKSQLTNGTPATNGTVTEQPKTKKKVIRRVKKTNPDGTPKKATTKAEKLSNGTSKENSPDVVQEITEDKSTVGYIVKLGQSPVNDGISLADEINSSDDTAKMQNGVEKRVNGVVADDNSLVNGSVESSMPTLDTVKAPNLAIVDQTKPSHSISTIPQATDSEASETRLSNGVITSSNEDKLSTSSSDTITIKNLTITEDKSSTLSVSNLPSSAVTSSILNRRTGTASPLTLNDSTIAPSSSNSFLSNRRLSSGNPMSPTESDFSMIDDISFSSTLTAPSSIIPGVRLEKRSISPISEYPPDVKMRGMADVPVVALQLVLSMFTYKELCELRRVHPHWDELCGQLLNSGYYELIHKADVLMTECQRRVNSEKHLQRPLQVLTNLQVHVLNPVDILRAAMDEGVLCFPYGEILDKSFDLLNKIDQVMGMSEDDGDGVVLNWDRLAKLSRIAQVHYRQFVEPEVEKRMTEVYKLSAQQRLQRLDSFLVETTVNKLEKVNEKTRDELKWEVEQLKSQNTQLKKDNRDLKQTCAKLESRIETIERKLKTLGRLLQ